MLFCRFILFSRTRVLPDLSQRILSFMEKSGHSEGYSYITVVSLKGNDAPKTVVK